MEKQYQYKPVLFYFLVAVLTWIPWFAAIRLSYGENGEAYASLLNLLGLLAPTATALILVFFFGTPALKADFKDRFINLRRLSPTYLIVLFATPPIVVFFSIWLSLFFGQSSDQFGLVGDPAGILPLIILALILAPLIEETGWRGYGVDSLRSRMGPLGTSLWFGVLWSLWHAPLVFIKGTYHYDLANMENPIYLANFFVSVIPVAVLANWLYYKHNRSIIAGMLTHSMLNGMAVLFNATQFTKCIVTVVYVAVAVAIIILDRKAFSDGPRDFVHGA